jgi:hypothetical protein
MNLIKKKKATGLLQETIGKFALAIFVLALVLISIFYYSGVNILNYIPSFGNYSGSGSGARDTTEYDIARESLAGLSNQILTVPSGEARSYPITGPKRWYVVFFAKGLTSPSSCYSANCLCMCKSIRDTSDCAKIDICRSFEIPLALVTAASDNNIDLSSVPRTVYMKNYSLSGVKIYTSTEQIKYESSLDDLLYTEVVVNGQKMKAYEQMINIVEGKSKVGIEDGNLLSVLFAQYNQRFGQSGWAMRYSKEGPTYTWNYADGNPQRNVWDIAHLGDDSNVVAALETKIPYYNGVLKTQFRILKK